MKRAMYKLLGMIAILGSVLMSGEIKMAVAEVNVGLSVNLGFPMPQEVVLAPSGVYFVNNPGINVFFYGGYWWAPQGNLWYRSRDYNRGWVVVEPQFVPASVIHVYGVPNYQVVYKEKGRHMPYGQWKKQGYQMKAVERGPMFDDDHQRKFGKPMKHQKHDGKKGKHGRGN